jgi:hypothetical protein
MPRLGHALLVFSCALAAAACAGTKLKPPATGDGGATGAGGMAGATSGRGGTIGTGGVISVGGSTGSGGTGACVPSASCTPPNGQYCGLIGNGCPGGKLDCGTTCANGWTCEMNQCVGGASVCTPLTCGTYCGEIGDGCGRKLTCNGCAAGRECRGGLCVDPGCVPITCAAANNVRYCGTVGDGCGGTLECGTCPNGGTCGGTGYDPNVCNDPTCQKISCTPMGGQYCGTIGNGCGGTQDCGACANGMACATTGTSAHICPGSTTTTTPTCTGATKTTISGTVYDPAGVNPLYNVIVYIPSGALPTLAEGVSCDKCGAEVNAPFASALTDVNGHFSMTLEPVPSTTNVPLVMQVGKWRRQITIPSLQTCKDNPLTDKNQTRLPRTSAEGHIPRIAVTTGGSDALECLLRRVGIADTEFTNDAGAGRVHLYAGGKGTNSLMAGGTLSAATTLWGNRTQLAKYDVTLLSCEGSTSEFLAMKPQASIDNVTNYANSGGRVFMSHLHYIWLQKSPMFAGTATYIGTGTPPTASASDALNLTINQTFPKGMALAQWLAGPVVMASPTLGTISVAGLEHSVTAVTAPTTEWIYLPTNTRDPQMRRSVQYMSFNTPVGTPDAMQCGKAVFTDIHIKQSLNGGGGDDSDPSKPFPMGCKTNMMTPQAKALEFLFFDLTSCVEPPDKMPTPPIPQPPGTTTGPPPTTSRPPVVPPPPPPPPPPDPG